MAAAVAVIILLQLFMTSSRCQEQDVRAILLKVVNAIEKLVGFYKSSYEYMNLDGIFGLKVLEGQIKKILDEHGEGQHASLSPLVVQRLEVILKDTKWVGDSAMSSVKADDEKYFKDLEYVIAQPWNLFKRHRRIEPSIRWEIPVYQSSKSIRLDENTSDKCMMEITSPNKTKDDASQSVCSLSQKCGMSMTKRGLTDYSITHQLLWTALAEKAGCVKQLDQVLQKLGFPSTEHMQMEFCTNNYYEMLAVVHVYMRGKVKGNYQDLFLEQQFVCPNLGFFEFLKKEYLDQILSWQQPSGCFGKESENDASPLDQAPLKLGTLNALKNKTMPANLDFQKQNLQKQVKHQVLKAMRKKNPDEDVRVHQQQNSLKFAGIEEPKHPAFGQLPVKALHAHAIKKKNMPLNQKLPAGYLDEVVGPQVNLPNKFQGNLPIKHQGGLPSIMKKGRAPPGQSNNMQVGSLQNHVGLKLPAAQGPGMKKIGGMPAQISKLQHHLPHRPVIPGVLGDRLQGRKAPTLYETGHGTGRKLLVEKEMPGGCLAHKSGVACGALVMYLRYLIDPGPMNLFAPHDFFPNGPRGLLGDEDSYKKVMNFLSMQMQNTFDKDKNDNMDDVAGLRDRHRGSEGGSHVIGANEEEEEEEEEDEDEEYDDRDEMYPDTGGGAGQPQQHERKVVHFGAHDKSQYRDQKKDDYVGNKADENDEYANEDEEEDGVGADYIKRGKDDDDEIAANANDIGDDQDDDTEYTYYDDNDNTEQGIVRRHMHQPPPQNGARIRTHTRHKPHPPMANNLAMSQVDSPPTKAVVLLLSATSIVLVVFMYRFIRKRRIHIRPHNRGFFKL